MGHLGYELYPKKFMQSGWSRFFNSSTHHNMHHSKFKGNFGLYFRFWDKWMGTEFKDYETTFNQIVNRQKSIEFVPSIDNEPSSSSDPNNMASANI